jgi:hypothetical protein
MSEPIILHATKGKKTLTVYGRAIAQELVGSGEWSYQEAEQPEAEAEPEAVAKPATRPKATKGK